MNPIKRSRFTPIHQLYDHPLARHKLDHQRALALPAAIQSQRRNKSTNRVRSKIRKIVKRKRSGGRVVNRSKKTHTKNLKHLDIFD